MLKWWWCKIKRKKGDEVGVSKVLKMIERFLS
jgi:hypothetical protein